MSWVGKLAERLAAGDELGVIDVGIAAAAARPSEAERAEIIDWAHRDGPSRATRATVAGAVASASATVARALTDEAEALRALDRLQSDLLSGTSTQTGLDTFAGIGRWLLDADVGPTFDMGVDTREDDLVFLWTAGAMALRRHVARLHRD